MTEYEDCGSSEVESGEEGELDGDDEDSVADDGEGYTNDEEEIGKDNGEGYMYDGEETTSSDSEEANEVDFG